MGDDADLVDEALALLREIRKEYRDERRLSDLAGLLAQQIRPTMAFDSAFEERERIYERTPKEFAEEAERVLAKRKKPPAGTPSYKTPPFKCLEDFEKCKKHSSSKMKITCRVVFAICIGKQLIPFTKLA